MTDAEKCGGALWTMPPKIHTHCLRCGRKLKSQEAKERGYGKICWEKRVLDCQRNLF